MSEDWGIMDALATVCAACLICIAVVFGSLNLWQRYVAHYQQAIGMTEHTEGEQPWLNGRSH